MQKFLDWYLKFYPIEGVSQKRRIFIHITFWIVMLIYNVLIGSPRDRIELTVLRSLLFMLQAIIIFYGVTYLAIPKLLSNKLLFQGLLILFFIYGLNYQLNLVFYYVGLENEYFDRRLPWVKYVISYVDKGFWGMFNPQNIFFEFNSAMLAMGIPFLLKMGRTITKYAMKVEALSGEKTLLEMASLRTKLSPNYLLNSLNNIYNQVENKETPAGKSIVVLSDLMKYVRYNSGEELVDLDSEINFIKDYVDLEKLRGKKHLKIQFLQEGEVTGYKIAPLILINYVENAFKHVESCDEKVSLIDIDIKFINETLYVRIENDFIEKPSSGKKNKESGVGIANIRKRLELLYPRKHSLTINQENNKFLVEIMIKLKKE